MNPLLERYPDLLNEQDDPALVACIADLDASCAALTLPPEHDRAIAHALSVQASQPARRTLRGALARRLPRPALRWRAAPLLMATLLVGSGSAAYFHASGPTPVDAQTVLHRAADAGPGANEAANAKYSIAASDGRSGTADVWIGYDSSGTASELSLNLTTSQAGQSDMNAGLVAVGTDLLKAYDQKNGLAMPPGPGQAGQGPVTSVSGIPPASAPSPDQALKGIVVGTLLAEKLSKQPDAYQLQQETLDGVPVYALHGDGVTYYFNAQTYVLEGADWSVNGTTWRARLTPGSYRTMPISSVPRDVFGSQHVTGGPGAGVTIQGHMGAGIPGIPSGASGSRTKRVLAASGVTSQHG